jgi:hypothetical protein
MDVQTCARFVIPAKAGISLSFDSHGEEGEGGFQLSLE